MKLNKEARELLDRYLLGVKRELTGKQREDIAAEIESYLLDLLEERFPKSKEIVESQMKEILQEMGAPRKIAEMNTKTQKMTPALITPRERPEKRASIPILPTAWMLKVYHVTTCTAIISINNIRLKLRKLCMLILCCDIGLLLLIYVLLLCSVSDKAINFLI